MRMIQTLSWMRWMTLFVEFRELLIIEVLLNRVNSRAGKSIINNNCQDKKEQGRDLATSSKTKISKSLERRRNKLEAQSKPDTRPRIDYKEWFLIPLVSQDQGIGGEMMIEGSILGMILICLESLSEEGDSRLIRGLEDLILVVIDLCQRILEETKGDRDEDLIFKLYLDSDIYHTYIHKTLTLAEVGSSSGRPRPACLPDPTKKRRISQTIDQKLKLPKNESSSSGLDDQQTENATEETTLIPQIKKGVHKVLITSTPYTTYCALLLYIYSKLWKDNLTIVITQGTLPRSP
ncbi:hypothetical protein PPACK8108_LOCUS3752 [Phakopsora pachyrhizi]|uniref:Uncharacterized protein n=1 Tax=Phakopsora pachyrhizi TaxID=170000 RepID=A0AAV0AL59_PHAPC|nr:hypothetical protein PPACK8108_LOCUS3752 [Phakopsora pachyrhizi]